MARNRLTPAALVLVRVGIPQRRLAERLGVGQQQVSRILAGQCTPPAEFVADLRVVAGPDAAEEIADILGLAVAT